MTIADLVTEPYLVECLRISHETKLLCLQLLTLLEQPLPAPTSPVSPTAPTLGTPGPSQIERMRAVKRLEAMMTQLRSLHRNSFMAARERKEETRRVRDELDVLNLELQNLYYEQRHLRGEISACRDFPHKYTQLPLVSEAEFLAANPSAADLDPHALMIARIKDERASREKLDLERKRLQAKKQALISENKKRGDELVTSEKSIEKISNDIKGMFR